MSVPAWVFVVAAALGVPLLLLAWLLVARARREARIAADVAALFESPEPRPRPPITDADLEGLPEPLQRWLRAAGVVGRPPITAWRMRQRGRMRTGPDQPWLPLIAEEYGRVPGPDERPGYLWCGQTVLNGTSMTAHDRYREGTGEMRIRLAHTFTLTHATGPEIDEAMLLRWFAQLPFFPTFALDPRVTWEEVDAGRVRGTLTDGPHTVQAVFVVHRDGRVLDVVAERPRATADGFVRCGWHTPMRDPVEVEGVRVPAGTASIWIEDGHEFCYVETPSVEEVGFDVRGRLGEASR